MPVQMRHRVAEAGQINLVRLDQQSNGRFNGKDETHQMTSFRHRQIGHFPHMRAPNHPAESGKSQPFFTVYQNNVTE
jgi:hypothetical protein